MRYQACDGRQCFLPETAQVEWKIKVMPFDRIRATDAVTNGSAPASKKQ